MPRSYGKLAKLTEPNQIFVFGSNTQGRHGRGAAKIALDNYGAKWGWPSGFQGKSYAIVTTDLTTRDRRPHYLISQEILELYQTAHSHPNLEFLVAYADLGTPPLCGYSHKELAFMFREYVIPDNVLFSDSYIALMEEIDKECNELWQEISGI